MRFGDSSLQHLLLGIEDCDKISRNQDWFAKWEKEGRRYKLERHSNNAAMQIPSYTVQSAMQDGKGSVYVSRKGKVWCGVGNLW